MKINKQAKNLNKPVYRIPSELRQGDARTSSGMVNGSFWKIHSNFKKNISNVIYSI